MWMPCITLDCIFKKSTKLVRVFTVMCLHATYVCYLSLSFLFCSFTRLKVSVDDHPLDKETELFGNNGNHVKLLIEKKFLDLKHLFRKSINHSYQSYHEDILDVASNDLTSKPNVKKKSLHFANI